MVIEKTDLLPCESVYWLNMNADTGNTVKQYGTCLDFQHTQPHELPSKLWEIVGADMFSINS